MNIKQKSAVVIGLIALIISAFYPVWSARSPGGQIEFFNTRRCLYSNGKDVLVEYIKTIDDREQVSILVQGVKILMIDYHRMMVEWTIIVLLVVGAVIILKDSRKDTPAAR